VDAIQRLSAGLTRRYHYYHDRAAAYKAKLTALDQAYRDGLAACARRDIVTSHAAFGYLGARYN